MASMARVLPSYPTSSFSSQHVIAVPSKPFWNFTIHEIERWISQHLTPGIGPNQVLGQNLKRALLSASSYDRGDVGSGGGGQPNPKRPKIENNGTNNGSKGDVYQILDPSFAKSNGVASSELSTGAILSRMTLGGLVNALAGVEGGVVDTLTCIPLNELTDSCNNMNEAAKKEEAKKHMDAVIHTAGDLPLKEVIKIARGLHRSIAAR